MAKAVISRLVTHLKENTPFLDDPLVVVDVGCSNGVMPVLRQFEPHLSGLGIDPLVSEIARLAEIETNPAIAYAAAWVQPAGKPSPPRAALRGWRTRSSSAWVIGKGRS